MASIAEWIEKIKTAIYGEEVRGAIWQSLDAMNTQVDAINVDSAQIEQNKQDIATNTAAITALNSSVTFLSGGSAAVGDANKITQTGVYKAISSTANTPITGNHYVIYHATYTDSEAYQMAISATLRLYIRTMQGSTWSPWQEK